MYRTPLCFLFAALCAVSFAQSQVWQSTPLPAGPPPGSETYRINRYASYRVDQAALRSDLLFAPMERSGAEGSIVFMPSPDGSLRKFRLFESPIQTPAIQRQTGVRTYAGQGVDDPWATGRFDIGINGFHGMVYSPSGDYFIEPLGSPAFGDYIVFLQRDCDRTLCFKCYTTEGKSSKTPIGPPNITPKRPGPNRREYRLAIKGTGEYTQFFGSVTSADANSVTVMNRINGVYERDIAIRMNIVNLVNFPDPVTDPYSPNPTLTQNQTTCDAAPGDPNYDIGHLFHRGGGGVAVLNSVGVTGQKARGLSGLPNPTGDPFAIDYVAHEMGHQYGANHSFNSTSSACGGGNRSSTHAYEPGSGSTIMAYAGICSPENVQLNSDDYFHIDSQVAIESWRNNAASGGSTIVTGNNAPVVNAGADFTIPQDTPFRLTAGATDADGDSLTYCWEQFNLGSSLMSDEATRPLFRSLKPAVSATRWFPKQSTVLTNGIDQWENLPSVNRSMTFRCTVRDNRSGGGNYEFDSTVLTVSGTPFSVTSPNTGVVWAGGSNQTVTWNVGGGVSAANVRILLSLDGGNSFFSNSAITILASTPNDGSEAITVPNIASTQARIFVEAVGNVFYDVSNVNFTITPGSQFVPLGSYSVLNGDEPTHDLAALIQSDDLRLRVNANMSSGATSHLELHATSPIFTASRLKFYLECQGNTPSRTRKISLFNFQNSSWEEVGAAAGTTTDSFMIVDITSNASRFINSTTGEMAARVLKQSLTISRTSNRIIDLFDQTVWEVFP